MARYLVRVAKPRLTFGSVLLGWGHLRRNEIPFTVEGNATDAPAGPCCPADSTRAVTQCRRTVMDGQHFDLLLKSASVGGSRRRMLQGLVAGMLGVGAGGALSTGQAAASSPYCGCQYICDQRGGGRIFIRKCKPQAKPCPRSGVRYKRKPCDFHVDECEARNQDGSCVSGPCSCPYPSEGACKRSDGTCPV
jgi:hypothetical protein